MDEEYIRKQDALDCCPLIIDKDGEIVGTSAEYDRISELEPADVRPVVGATWDRRDKKHYNDFYCSRCLMLHHHVPTIKAIAQWNFCPNCGADMMGDDAE